MMFSQKPVGTQEEVETKVIPMRGTDAGRECQTSHGAPIVHIIGGDVAGRTAVSRQVRAAEFVPRSYGSVGEFLAADLDGKPGCILLDYATLGINARALQRIVASRSNSLPIIFLSSEANITAAVEAMKAGAADFLEKPVKNEVLIPAVQEAVGRSIDTCLQREQLKPLRTRYETLTRREVEVFERLVTGKRNSDIAYDLSISVRTAKAHRARVMEKMEVNSVAALAHISDELGLTAPCEQSLGVNGYGSKIEAAAIWSQDEIETRRRDSGFRLLQSA